MAKFRKKPVEIDALKISRPMTIETPEGTMKGDPGDWLLIGVDGEQYLCKDELFRQTYEAVDQEAAFMLNPSTSQPITSPETPTNRGQKIEIRKSKEPGSPIVATADGLKGRDRTPRRGR